MIENNKIVMVTSGSKEKSSNVASAVVPTSSSSRVIHLEFAVAASDLDGIIQGLVKVIEEAEHRLAEQKRVVNGLCLTAGRAAVYQDVDKKTATAQLGNIQPDQYYGQPLASAIRAILEMRRANGRGPATVREIYDTLCEGGFKFEAKDENALRGLRQSLTKNSVTFHKLPNGSYGLLEWYPNAKPARPGVEEED